MTLSQLWQLQGEAALRLASLLPHSLGMDHKVLSIASEFVT